MLRFPLEENTLAKNESTNESIVPKPREKSLELRALADMGRFLSAHH
jgi:hypothetical protein